MKKFLTLALALVMALALAAPASAFVDYVYDADSEFDLDFYLTDYDTSYGLFNSTGVFTSLPEVDRGYVTNEVVAAVVEVLVPAGHGGDKVDLKVSSKNVVLGADSVASRENAKLSKATVTADAYAWAFTADGAKNKDEIALANNAATRKFLENDSSKDVTAAWLIFGRVLDDEASLTATLSNAAANYNKKLSAPAAGQSNVASYKIGDNKYRVSLRAVANPTGSTTVGSYVYVITPDTPNGNEVRLYTDADWKSKAMVVTDGVSSVPGATTAGTATTTTVALSGWTTGDSLVIGTTTYDYATYTTGAALAAALDAALADWKVTFATDTLTFTANAVGAPWDPATGAGTGPQLLAITATVAGQAVTQADTAGTDTTTAAGTGVGYYWVGTDGKLYPATMNANADLLPTQASTAAVSSPAAAGFLGDVLADFGLNPALIGNILKPAYLGQYRSGNAIEEITIDIQPWQAYVTIPDIEVIDPPKTGDAATLAGFVMIVLAAAGVVVFKKVRA